ncbi:MAG: transcriptional regulator [Actinobacteria bacterium]|nr:transcriptional regulator [Actinomycetota bacterium]
MPATPVNETKRRLVDLLKRSDENKVTDLAAKLGVTDNAVRQHLEDLEASGLVSRQTIPNEGRRGRPSSAWRLTDLATELFPDRHADLTVELIEAIREATGEKGLDEVIRVRSKRQLDAYQDLLAHETDLHGRLDALANQRTAEGYLAEVTTLDDGTLLLVEHNCPICDAAANCQNLCREELEIFQAVLGDEVSVERTTHVLAGDQRCSYEIRPFNR